MQVCRNISLSIASFFSLGLRAQDIRLTDYFARSLKNNAAKEGPSSHGFKITELDRQRNAVWQSWKKANQSDAGELPIPSPVNIPVTHQWPLVDEDPLAFYYVSKGDKPARGYSLFINLHGSGPKDEEWASTLGLSGIYQDAPSIFFIPQIPNEKRYRWGIKPLQEAYEKLFRLALISDQVDPDKMYVIGISEGGYGSYRLGAFYADYLAGAGPMAAGEPMENSPVLNYRNIALAFETGQRDFGFGRNKYTKDAKKKFDSLSVANPGQFIHSINLQAGREHGIDYTRVTPWLIKYKRNPYPKEVSWLNFSLYGRYRKGFCNLVVMEPFDISDTSRLNRTLFNLKIDSVTNTIQLSAHALDKENKQEENITQGKIGIYLSPELINWDKPVTLFLNNRKIFRGRIKADKKNLIESCLLFGDPQRLYPGKIEIDFSK